MADRFTVRRADHSVVVYGADISQALDIVGAWHADALRAMNPRLLASCHYNADGYVVRAESPHDGALGTLVVSHGAGGWTIHYPTSTSPGGLKSSSKRQGYAEDWRDHLSSLAPGALYVDQRTMPDDQLVSLAVRGPMPCADVPAGLRRTFHGLASIDRTAPFLDASSLDYVSAWDYAHLAAMMGARTDSAREAARAPYLRGVAA